MAGVPVFPIVEARATIEVTPFGQEVDMPDIIPRHADALAVLDATRPVVARAWVQHTWYVVEAPAGRRRAAQRFLPTRLDQRRVVAACLVGAVMNGAWRLSPRPEYAYPAIDALWYTLFDAQPPDGDDPVGPLVPPLVRVARVRDLTTWNDRGHRTKEQVLRLVDLAAARVAGVRTPRDARSIVP